MKDVVSILSECSDSISIGSICTFVREDHGVVQVDAIKKTAYPDDPDAGYVHMPARPVGNGDIEDGVRVMVMNIKDGIATVVKAP